MKLDEQDFGPFLSAVQERDIDLLLLEEFHSSPQFASWFAAHCGVERAIFDGAWHSVFDADGETDVLLRVHDQGRRVGILIENKIAAMEQERQGERYHIRGSRAQQGKKFDSYVTCICAPRRYLESLTKDSQYTYQIPLEDVAEWFARAGGTRDAWKLRVVNAAIEQGRRGYTMIVDPIATQFHRDYWEFLSSRHSDRLEMNRPGDKGKKSTWLIFRGRQFPRGVSLHHKLDQQVVELGFENCDLAKLAENGASWPDHVLAIPKGKMAVLQIRVPFVDMTKPLREQEEAIGAVFAAAMELLPYAHALEGP